MGIIGEKLNIDFVVSTGDNFYDDGLTGVDDPAFEESFTNVYTAQSLQKNWYNGEFNFLFLSYFSCRFNFNYFFMCFDYHIVYIIFVISCYFLFLLIIFLLYCFS